MQHRTHNNIYNIGTHSYNYILYCSIKYYISWLLILFFIHRITLYAIIPACVYRIRFVAAHWPRCNRELLFCAAGHRDDDGRNSGSNLSKKQRKARTAFTDHQLQTLEKSFERQKYLSVQDRMELAAKLNLSDTQVKTWYQNRRWA